jgi:hypothetical protein
LTRQLSASFGRPVEVASFELSLLGGPRLAANYITVAEDPRFGHEYFLRAERLIASLRWRSALRGKFEFGKLSFTRPSLNLVRSSDGRWNLESWLPPPTSAPSESPLQPQVNPDGNSKAFGTHARLYRIEVDSGRINFKRGVEKHPFALVDVNGSVEQESAGRWRMDLEARPMRAGVVVQEAGGIHVRGRVGGTSARLQPVELLVSWQEASVSDALRLARGHDFGIRGLLALELVARSEGRHWSFDAIARLRNLHRWDLPQRAENPALNLSVQAQWWPHEARVQVSNCVLEAPRSGIRATGFFRWASPANARFRFVSSGLNLADVLAWYRSFRRDVAEDVALEGNAGVTLEISGWPPHIEHGVLASVGARLRVAGLREPVSVGRVVLRLERARSELLPVALSLAPAQRGGTLRVDAKAYKKALREGMERPHDAWTFDLNLVGQTERSQDLLATAAALGWDLRRGWSVKGPARLRLKWRWKLDPFSSAENSVMARDSANSYRPSGRDEAQPTGTIELRGLMMQPPFLNQSVVLTQARIDLEPGERRVSLISAQAFGAKWSGWLRQSAPAQPWEFSLASGRLNVAELDRWLNPAGTAGRRSLLERLLPKPALIGAWRGIWARGRISLNQLVLDPLELGRLRAQVEMQGSNVQLGAVRAEFYGGTVRGSVRAEFSDPPVYRVEAQLDGVDVEAIAGATRTLAGRFAGTASGELSLLARGIGRERLLSGLEGSGTLKFQEVRLRGWDLMESLRTGRVHPGLSEFRTASAEFGLAAGRVHLEKLRLVGARAELETEGTVDSSGALDLRLRVVAWRPLSSRSEPGLRRAEARLLFPIRPGGPGDSNLEHQTFQLGGPVTAPQITAVMPEARR